MRSRLAAALVAAFLGTGIAVAAPADDLREAQRLYQQGRVPQATEKVDAFLRAQPKDPQGRFLKGLLLTEQKKSDEAIKVFTALTEDFPELPEPYNNLAVLYASQGDYDKAKAALELAIQTHPSYATAHENLGDIYAQLASRAYDRALQLDKNNAAAQVKLAMVKDLFSASKAPAKGGEAAKPAAPAPATKAAPPKPEVVAKAEPKKEEPKAQAPQPAPAKSEPPAKTEPAKAEAPKTAPAVASVKPAAPAADDKAQVTEAIQRWARAWSAKDVAGYLAAYSPEFEVPGGDSRADWEKQRRERIERPKSIDVAIDMRSVKVDGNEAVATFRQAYRSDTLRNTITKTLRLVRSGDRWLIQQERVGG